MPYGGRTPFYGIPYPKEGDVVSDKEERRKALLLEHLLRAAILAEGETRVFKEGNYSVTRNSDDSLTVILVGTPAVRGVARSGLVEINGQIRWDGIPKGGPYYLYLKSSRDTYFDPAKVDALFSPVQPKTPECLLLASIENKVGENPTLNENPSGKPIGANLFDLLNDPTDPFGSTLSQSILRVTKFLFISLSSDKSFYVKQGKPDARKPVILIDNSSEQPEIASSRKLRFSDKNIESLDLSDELDNSLVSSKNSILSALNSALGRPLVLHVEDGLVHIDASKSNSFILDLESDCEIQPPVNGFDGQIVSVRVRYENKSQHSILFPSELTKSSKRPSFSSYSLAPALPVDRTRIYLRFCYSAQDLEWDLMDIT